MTLTRKEFLKYLAGTVLAVPLLGASCNTKKKDDEAERRKEHKEHWKDEEKNQRDKHKKEWNEVSYGTQIREPLLYADDKELMAQKIAHAQRALREEVDKSIMESYFNPKPLFTKLT